jgi:hypothetical protein
MSIDYYDKQGNRLARGQYLELLETIGPDYKQVAVTEIGDVLISTVWLGMDHGYGDGEPMIFETMQFGGECDSDMERYSSLEEAQAGHDAWVRRIQEDS